jgi:hypothetical protein
LTICATLALAGCATSAVEDDFGNSVAAMIESQKAHPEVSANPDPNGVDGTDADRVVRVLETYREDVARPENVSQDIIVNIGGNR